MDNVKLDVTEEMFHHAFNLTPYVARQRLVKKMSKRIYRVTEHGKAPQPRSPKDLEQYVENFVFTYGGRVEKA